MKRFFLHLLLDLVLLVHAAPKPHSDPALPGALGKAHPFSYVLAVGEQARLKKMGQSSVTVTNPKAVKVNQQGGDLIINARSPGRAHIATSYKSKGIDVLVYSQKLQPLKESLDQWL